MRRKEHEEEDGVDDGGGKVELRVSPTAAVVLDTPKWLAHQVGQSLFVLLLDCSAQPCVGMLSYVSIPFWDSQ